MRSEPRNILKIFLNFTDFEPHYSYKIYSYRKKECISYISIGNLFSFSIKPWFRKKAFLIVWCADVLLPSFRSQESKRYVQHVLQEQSKLIWELINQRSCYVYIAGWVFCFTNLSVKSCLTYEIFIYKASCISDI